MTQEAIKVSCLEKTAAWEDLPFGAVPVCYKVNGKIFAQLYPDKITVKCTLCRADVPAGISRHRHRGYHCPPVQQPYWNTIILDGFPDDVLLTMIDHAYETVVASFSRKVQVQIRSEALPPSKLSERN